jgi:hypothetical protein
MGARLTKISNFKEFTGLRVVLLGWNSLSSFPNDEISSELIELGLQSNQLNSLNISNFTILSTLYVGTNHLEELDISNNPNIDTISANTNRLSQSAVNNILINLDNNGLSNGNCQLSSGTNAAPSGDGITAKTNLQSKSWSVYTN